MVQIDSRPGEAVFVVGPLSTIEQVSDAAVDLTGYTHNELVGARGSLLIPSDAQPATAASIDRMRRGELFERLGRRFCRKDGTELTVDVRGQPLPGGRLALFVRARPANDTRRADG